MSKTYTSNASVQVMLFADRLEVWNPGELPSALTIEDLRVPHPSIPHNPLIAEPMFLATYAEKAGSGILDMIKRCRVADVRTPLFRQSGGQFVQTLWRPKAATAAQVATQVTAQVGTKSALSRDQVQAHDEAHDEAHDGISVSERRIMEVCLASPRTTPELLTALGYAMRTGNFKRGLKHLIALDLLEMSVPGSPRSKKQKYRLTHKGRVWLAGGKTVARPAGRSMTGGGSRTILPDRTYRRTGTRREWFAGGRVTAVGSEWRIYFARSGSVCSPACFGVRGSCPLSQVA